MPIGEGQDGDALIQGGLADDLLQLAGTQIQLKKPEAVNVKEDASSSHGSHGSHGGSSPNASNGTGNGTSGGAGGCEGAAEEALKLTNEYRAKHGVGPLELDPKITKLSQSWADELEAKGFIMFGGGSPHAPMDRGKGVYN